MNHLYNNNRFIFKILLYQVQETYVYLQLFVRDNYGLNICFSSSLLKDQ